MNPRLRNPLALVAVLCAVGACDREDSLSPTAPITPPRTSFLPSAVPGASSDAIRIAVGEKISGIVTLSDPTCDSGFDAEPCQRFAITVPTAGALTAHVTTFGPYSLTIGIGSSIRQWGTTVAANVQAGSTYEISVALHGAIPGLASQAFELTTSLEPR